MTIDRICRICWNSSNWQHPTGEAARIESDPSYVKRFGFGHEEWLFRSGWLIGGDRYSYLQPIGKFRDAYVGHAMNLLLYTITPEKRRLWVGILRNAFVPDNDEIDRAAKEFRRLGWIREMQKDCRLRGIPPEPLNTPIPYELLNIRFRPADAEIFDPMPQMRGDSSFGRRYHPMIWSGILPDEIGDTSDHVAPSDDDPTRSESARTRAAQQGYTYDPDHVRIQNRVYEILCARFGKKRVGYESRCVDLRLDTGKEIVYFEVKTNPTARKCIREALGQLLEYSGYPGRTRAHRLVVVARAAATAQDRTYVQELRTRYGIPIEYAQYDEEDSALEGWN